MSKCKNCGKELVFLPTKTGKVMPVNKESVETGDEIYIHGKHISHFSDCPGASGFRREYSPPAKVSVKP